MFIVYFITQGFGHWVLFHLTSVSLCNTPIILELGICFLSTFFFFFFNYKMHLPLQDVPDLSCTFPAPVLDSAISPGNTGSFIYLFI